MADDRGEGSAGGGAEGLEGREHYFALPVGTKLFEFEIVSVLGHGGFGITYRALDTDLKKAVAIKEFFPNDLAGRTASVTVRAKSAAHAEDFQHGLKAFLEEARLIARFQHANIVGVRRFFEAHGTGYIVFSFETGETLSQRLAKGALPEAELRQMLDGVLAGLEVVHEAAVLHRDLKPTNIMLRPDGAPVLIDFGAARDFQQRHSRTVTAIASAGYAPPEQYGVGGQQGPWSDFYALGAIAYRCVTGTTPPDSLRRLRRDPLTPAVVAAKGKYGDSLLDSIDWMLRIEEADRPGSVAQVRAALAGGAIPERKVSGGKGHDRPGRPLRWAVVAASILGLASAAAYGFTHAAEVTALTCGKLGLLCAESTRLAANSPATPPPTGAGAAPTAPAVAPSPPGASPNPPADQAAPAAGSRPSAKAETEAPLAASGQLSEAAQAWAVTKDTTSISVLEAFINRYKDTIYGEMARARLEELKKQAAAAAPPPPDAIAWDRIKDSKNPEDVRSFLKQFPDSAQQAAAIARLAQLEPKVTECDELAADPDDPRKIADAPGVERYKIDSVNATLACERAVREFPDALRLQYQLGRAHRQGKRYEEAYRWLSKAAQSGYAEAMDELGALYLRGQGTPRNISEARQWFIKSADLGSTQAMRSLGFSYAKGFGGSDYKDIPPDYDQARRWFQKAADLGNKWAMINMAWLCENGQGGPRDYKEAAHWYEASANLGVQRSMNDLGELYMKGGYGLLKDYGEALRWFTRADELGYSGAAFNLGWLVENGFGVTKDTAKARALYMKAANKGNSGAMYRLGILNENGEGGPRNYGEARNWYIKAINLGNFGAMYQLHEMYKKDRGSSQDHERWVQALIKAADAENARAPFQLGLMYSDGIGVPINYVEARRWYSKGVDLNFVGAMINLGVLNARGHGGMRNCAEARRLYAKAAESPNATDAQKTLARNNLAGLRC